MAANDLHLGCLAGFRSYDVTPHIGTRFPEPSVQLSGFLTAENSEALIGDLAKLISHRGVVFFSNQDLTIVQQEELMRRMGNLSGRPKTSGLHQRFMKEPKPEHEPTVTVISANGKPDAFRDANFDAAEKLFGKDSPMLVRLASCAVDTRAVQLNGARASTGWHSDISFEKVPPDYTLLKMHNLPKVGGDTLWASTYEAYDRLTPPYQKFLEGLSAIHDGNFVTEFARTRGLRIQDSRGSPGNSGEEMAAVHPVVRTNPVTGYKALFVNKWFTTRIMELSQEESDHQLDFLFRHISENHDLQVRYRWEKDDVAIWDNRATLHTASYDFGYEPREAFRVIGIGEKPYLDSQSKSRREAIGKPYFKTYKPNE